MSTRPKYNAQLQIKLQINRGVYDTILTAEQKRMWDKMIGEKLSDSEYAELYDQMQTLINNALNSK